MPERIKKVVYVKASSQGPGSIPIGSQGKVLKCVKHPVTTKLLVDFSRFGKAIVPLNSVKVIK